MPEAIIMIGPPGSGKSTTASEILKSYLRSSLLIECHSLDKTRLELFGTEDEQGGPEVWFDFLSKLRQDIKLQRHLIIDNTSVRAKFRKNLRNLLPSDYEVVYEVMMTPLEECLRRNASRERKVPEDLIIKMHRTFVYNLNLLPQECDNISYHYPDGTETWNKRK